jgi:cyclase
VVLAIDAKQTGPATWKVFVNGGRTETELDAVAWAKEGARRGAGEILLTSMDRDGTNDGFDIELLRRMHDAVPVPIIASGGAGSAEHCVAALVDGRADAALAASIFHRSQVSIGEVKAAMTSAGVAARTDA